LQFVAALLVQNFVKIRHHLPKLYKSTQEVTFFQTQCSNGKNRIEFDTESNQIIFFSGELSVTS